MTAPLAGARRSTTRFLGKHLINPLVRTLADRGVTVPGIAILETIGRTSGLPRRVPVTNGLDGRVFWIVSEHGRRSAYVRNLERHPRVRVKVGRRWLNGTAMVLDDDDTSARLAHIRRVQPASRLSATVVKVFGTERMTIRISLDASQSS